MRGLNMTIVNLERNTSTRISVTVNRGGDTFTFLGLVTCITESCVTANVASNLIIDELVSLEFLTSPSQTLEKQARVRNYRGYQYQFELLSLNDE